jgi:H(+)-transporting ATP synthase subunit D
MERLPPTRLSFLQGRRRLSRLGEGAALLRRKREALVSELFRLARPALDARAAIAERTVTAYPALLRALGLNGSSGLLATAWPIRDITVEIRAARVWGIPVADITRRPELTRHAASRATTPAAAGLTTLAAASEFERLADLLLAAAPREMLLQRLGQALAQTSRQVNTLERRIAPALASRVAAIRHTLEEREREEHSRLRQMKTRIAAASDRSQAPQLP